MSCVICGKWNCTDHVGYKGQRYEVRVRKQNGVASPYGWTDEADGGVLAKSAWLNPSTIEVRVIDLKPETKKP